MSAAVELGEAYLSHGLWPTAVVVAVIVLRRPLGAALPAITRRINRVSFASFDITLTEAVPVWQSASGADVRGLTESIVIADSASDTLTATLRDESRFDFMVVDLGRGEDWLTTRLFLFTAVLEQMRGLRAVVFVHTRDTAERIFLGVASAADVTTALAKAYPWLDAGWAAALWPNVATEDVPGPLPPATGSRDRIRPSMTEATAMGRSMADAAQAAALGQRFVAAVQTPIVATPFLATPDPGAGWLKLPVTQLDQPVTQLDQPVGWEHAKWIGPAELTDGALKRVAAQDACVVDHRDWTDEERTRAVLAVPAPYVALLGEIPEHRFLRLIDRVALAQQVALRSAGAG